MVEAAELPEHHEDHPAVVSRNARRGLVLFAIYFALYMGFLLVNVYAPEKMAQREFQFGPEDSESARVLTLWGSNLAIVWGVGLIFAAIALSLLYMRLTKGVAAKGGQDARVTTR